MGIAQENFEQDLPKRQDNLETTALHLRGMIGVNPPEPVPYSGGRLIEEVTRATLVGPMDDETRASLGADTFPEGYVPEKLATISLIWAVDDPDTPPEQGRLAIIKTDVYADQLGIPLESYRVPLLPTEPIVIEHMPVVDLARLSSQFRDDYLSDFDATEQLFGVIGREEDGVQRDSLLLA
ncbi:MAG TPA: hypothetical protein VLE69_02510 [Candidatus Saccharimonadales bacterium]|nr:hypothetical protein [Candidatus Saccharimonadales bacterium]